MKVGARAPDLQLGVSAGSAEQIHFAHPRCPCTKALVGFLFLFLFWGEGNNFLRRAGDDFYTCQRFGVEDEA
jgi:hypothetical protein